MSQTLHHFFTLLTQSNQYHSINTNHYNSFHDTHSGIIKHALELLVKNNEIPGPIFSMGGTQAWDVEQQMSSQKRRRRPGFNPGSAQPLIQIFTGQWHQLNIEVTTTYIWQLDNDKLLLKKASGNDYIPSIMGIFTELGKSNFIYKCGNDTYQSSIFIKENSAILQWDTQGPTKDIQIITEIYK